MPTSVRPGDVLSERYRLDDLLDEARGGRFFRGFDSVLARHVAIHVIPSDDDRAPLLTEAARASVRIQDRRILRVLDTDQHDGFAFVVNEWGSGRSLDIALAHEGPLAPRRAAWICSEVAATLASAHEAGVAHGRLVPENVLIDTHGTIRLIGLAVDAALHGLPPGRRSSDVTDLIGVLYASLTGRWAGASDSGLPPAHLEGDQVLRPRRVRAGIPRPLDQLCDAGLNDHPYRGLGDITTVAGIGELLGDFVGDPAGMTEAEAARGRAAGYPAWGAPPDRDQDEQATFQVPVLPPDRPRPAPVTEEPPTEDPVVEEPVVAHTPPEDTSPEEPVGEEPAAGDPADVPTQAGMPVFDDDADQVAWISRSAEKPAPPPPLEEPEPRPLFAPEPEDGRPVRTPRAGTAAAAAAPREYWPWGESSSTGAGTGTGAVPPYDSGQEDSGYLDEVPGRSLLRVAMVLAALTALLLVIVFAFGIGRGDPNTDPAGESSGQDAEVTSQSGTQPVTGLTATDFDPQGDPPEENPDLVPLVVDGDPETSWRTMTYNENLGPAGLKTGVGVALDMGEVRAPRQVDVTFAGEGDTAFSLYLSDTAPRGIRELAPLTEEEGSGTVQVGLTGDERGRYLIVWLTSLPSSDGGYRGEIAEITVHE